MGSGSGLHALLQTVTYSLLASLALSLKMPSRLEVGMAEGGDRIRRDE
jgi:hypothetical protein